MKRALKLEERWDYFCLLISVFGMRVAIEDRVRRCLGLRLPPTRMVRPGKALHPLCIRMGSSDIDVYRQIFIDGEYDCLADLPDVRLVIDCGANVGYSSAYFLSQFPHCQVVAVEPDPQNFAMLRRNLVEYGDRAKLVHAGVWSHAARLALSQEFYRDGREWSRQVRLCGPDEKADFEGVDVGSLLACAGQDRISLLKVDVEGAEAVMFAENFRSWLDRVDAIVIELHNDTAFGNGSDVFFSAIRGQGFQVSRSGERTICRRPSP
jgi:FkbM family methyltransferase